MQPKSVYVNYAILGDGALAERSRLGDTDAFAELYRRHLTPIYRFIYRRVGGNVVLTEDLTSQVFLNALDNLPNYRERGYFVAWLFTIARRRLTDCYRKGDVEFLDDIPESLLGISDNLEDRENKERLKQLLTALDDEKRELLQLRFTAELSFTDMAVVLGKNEASVKMAFYRILDRLREQWEVVNE